MSQAATLTLSLAIPQTAGAFPVAPWPPSPGYSVQYTGAYEAPRIAITGAGTLTLSDFSALLPATGAQILLVTLDAVDGAGLALTAPVNFVMTGTTHGTMQLPIAGGAFAIVAPGTMGGVTGLAIVTTGNAVVRVQAAG